MAGDFARLGDFSDGHLSPQHQLHHAEPHRMRQCSQALGGLLKSLQVEQVVCVNCFHVYIIS